MALSVSSTISFYSHRLSKPTSKTLELKTLPLRPHSPSIFTNFPLCKAPFSNLSPIINRRYFKSYASAEEPETIDEDETLTEEAEIPESEIEVEGPSEIKSLFTVYKQAVLNGDEKTSSDIEVAISAIEDEKISLAEKVSILSGEISSGKEKYIRLQADFDNFRKRSEKERLTVRSNAQGEVIESLLPMVDNFERAKQQLKLETEEEKKIDASYQGIYKQFVEIMRSLQVAVVETVGKPFDPALHEAIAREESEEFEDGVVIQEFRRGFLLGERLLRPAMVKVSAGPGKRQTPTPAPEPVDEEQPVEAAAATVEEPAN